MIVLFGVFLQEINNPGPKDQVYKVRFVVHGHRYRDKKSFVHDTATLQDQSLRVMIAIPATYNLDVWSRDGIQAYVQVKVL